MVARLFLQALGHILTRIVDRNIESGADSGVASESDTESTFPKASEQVAAPLPVMPSATEEVVVTRSRKKQKLQEKL